MIRHIKKLIRIRYSLRGLLCVVTFLCVGIGSFSVRMQRAEKQAVAARMLQAGAVFVGYDYMLDEHDHYTANYRAPFGFLRRRLGNDFFSNVVRVEYPPGQLPDCGVAPLANLLGLRHLSLRGTKIGDADFSLDGLRQLHTLDLAFTDITDATVVHLAALNHLQSLDLTGTLITDASLPSVRQIATLKSLTVNDVALSDEAVQQLKEENPAIEVVWVNAPSQTHLAALRRLTQLGAVVDLVSEERTTADSDRFFCPGYRVAINGDRSMENHWKGVEADFALIEDIEGLSMLELNRLTLSRASLPWLSNLPTLRSLTLDSASLHGFSMPMGNYQVLHLPLPGTPIPFRYQDFISIPLLNWLSMLQIDNRDEALMATLGQLEKLEQIVLDRTRVSDRGIAELGNLKSLRRLGLRGTHITDSDMANLATIKSIEELDLSLTDVNDLGVSRLRAMPKLRKVNLSNPYISDKALEYLAEIPSLKELSLVVDGKRVTNPGVRDLQTKLPQLHITRVGD